MHCRTMKTNRKTRGKYLLLISVLMLMVLLCACRTRLTNNTEVSATITDEDGLITGTYEMRRADLGIPVAQKPIFTGWGSEEDYDDYSDLSSDSFDYSQTDDGWDEPDDIITADPTGDDTTISGGSTGTGSSTSSTTKKKSQSSSTTKKKTEKTEVTITLNLNDSAGTVNKMTVKKDTVYSSFLPTDVASSDENYVFNGWHTKKSSDSPVNLQDKATKDCTLYAHWKKKEKEPEKKPEEKKVYKVTLVLAGGSIDGDSSDRSLEVKDGKYPDLPTPTRDGYYFTGWFAGKTKIEPGSECSSDQTIEAHWETNKQHWDNRYSTASNSEAFNYPYYSDGDLVKGKKITDTEVPDYVVVSIDDYTEENADKKNEELSADDKYPNSVIIIIPAAIYKSDELRTVYKLILFKEMYKEASTITDEEITKAASDLNVELPDPPDYSYYPIPPAPES